MNIVPVLRPPWVPHLLSIGIDVKFPHTWGPVVRCWQYRYGWDRERSLLVDSLIISLLACFLSPPSDKTSYLDAVLNNQVRGSYLESLLSTEDDSHPDKDMVLLWCMRNGLKHFEVSAKYGTGLDEMMQEMALQALEPQEQIIKSTMDGIIGDRHAPRAHYRPNQELDLHKRYVPKEQSWLAFRPLHWCCKP